VLAKYRDHLGIGIDEQTGVQVQGECVTVLGKRNVRVCLPAPKGEKYEVKVFGAGSQLKLAELYRTVSSPNPAAPRTPAGTAKMN